jgi:hypothetical protein
MTSQQLLKQYKETQDSATDQTIELPAGKSIRMLNIDAMAIGKVLDRQQISTFLSDFVLHCYHPSPY